MPKSNLKCVPRGRGGVRDSPSSISSFPFRRRRRLPLLRCFPFDVTDEIRATPPCSSRALRSLFSSRSRLPSAGYTVVYGKLRRKSSLTSDISRSRCDGGNDGDCGIVFLQFERISHLCAGFNFNKRRGGV